MSEVFAEVRREDGRRKIMLNEKTTTNPKVSIMVSRTFPAARQPKKEEIVCEHCKKPRHTAETCKDLHGKPPDWKPKSFKTKGKGGSRAYQYGTENQDNAEKFSGTASLSVKTARPTVKALSVCTFFEF